MFLNLGSIAALLVATEQACADLILWLSCSDVSRTLPRVLGKGERRSCCCNPGHSDTARLMRQQRA